MHVLPLLWYSSISIRAPARGATLSVHLFLRTLQYFNPRSREGSDNVPGVYGGSSKSFQSALPRGERLCLSFFLSEFLAISIRAPARGATSSTSSGRSGTVNFNPRSREGSDFSAMLSPPFFSHFNPRSREGSDRMIWTPSVKMYYFNPRSREGSDKYSGGKAGDQTDFNPRSREGSDCERPDNIFHSFRFQSALPRGERHIRADQHSETCQISIRAPARGATDHTGSQSILLRISIRAPARGATGVRSYQRDNSTISIRAPARGATPCPLCPTIFLIFQSALPRGERRKLAGVPVRLHRISIRAPARGATSIFTKKFSSLLAKIV